MNGYEIVELKTGYGILRKGRLVISSIEKFKDAEYVCNQLNQEERENREYEKQYA